MQAVAVNITQSNSSSNSSPFPLDGTSVLDGLDVLDISVQYCHLPVQERYNYHALFYVWLLNIVSLSQKHQGNHRSLLSLTFLLGRYLGSTWAVLGRSNSFSVVHSAINVAFRIKASIWNEGMAQPFVSNSLQIRSIPSPNSLTYFCHLYCLFLLIMTAWFFPSLSASHLPFWLQNY